MASIFKRGKSKVWAISYFMNGKRVTKSLKTTDQKIAKELQKEYEVKLRKGVLEQTSQIKIEEFMKEYAQYTHYRTKTTQQSCLSILNKLMDIAKRQTINSIKREHVLQLLKQYENKAPKTYNNVLGVTKHFFGFAKRRGYIMLNPADDIRRKKVPQSLPKFFTDEEYNRIELASEGLPIYPMIVTARYTGMRLQELIHLEWQDFDWQRKVVRVLNKPKFNHTVKNHQSRVVPVGNELRDKLLDYIKPSGICFPVPETNGRKYSEWGPDKSLRTIFKKAGITRDRRFGWHDFRHTFASRLAQEGISIYKISKWMGHSDVSVTAIYAKFAPVYDEDIEKLTMEKKDKPNIKFVAKESVYENLQEFTSNNRL